MRFTLATLALALMTTVAVAQPDDLQRKTAAEAAFRQGKDQIAAGQVAEACESFAKSQELDPQLGTHYNLALCYEKLGRTASAWGLYSTLAEVDTNKGRKADATKRAKALAPRLVKVLLVLRDPTPGIKVERDGADITAAVGVATPVDPGRSMMMASAEGYEPWSAEVAVMGDGTTVTVEIPALTKKPVEAPPPDPTPDPIPEEMKLPPQLPPPSNDPGRGRRILGIGLGAGGVAALGVGVVFGMMAGTANDDAKTECGGDVTDCRGDRAKADDLVASARTRATVSTVALAVGGVAVVAGAVLYLTAPAKRERAVALTPQVGRDQVGVLVHGSF